MKRIHMRNSRLSALLLALLLSVSSLAACGGETVSADTETTPAAETTPETEEETAYTAE